ncbi:MAG: reverse transcriptase domain-containing protein [Candidatus Woesearchaeota archaeon]
MKTYRNLFGRLCSLENLELAFRKARKRKTLKQYVQEFEKDLDANLKVLHQELTSKTYSPLPLRTFILRDPKTRRISVSDFRDRIVHHAVCNVLEPVFEQYFIYDSYANRKGKGGLAALQRFDVFKRRISRNGRCVRNARDNNVVQGYVLKADVRHYFDAVDHAKLLEVIARRIADADVLQLITRIVGNHSGKVPGKGMPLGNLTSQFFANVYLNELDQFVKHKLKAKYYVRYVDDFVVLHHSKHQLQEWKEKIDDFLRQELLLELHPQKSKIHALGRGVDFLGFKCFYHFRLLRKRNIRKMLRRLECFKEELRQQKTSPVKVIESLHGWNAYAMHANTYNLRRAITNKVIELIQH